jgi:hypothetical protein
MADNIPNVPGGAIPPKKETGKVQPKKETVRINLPPKPSAAPTIKLPTLPPGGAGTIPLTPSPTAPGSPAPAPTAPRATAAPVAQRPAAPAAPKPAPRPAAPTVSGLDKFLAIAAMVVCLAAAGSAAYLAFFVSIEQ